MTTLKAHIAHYLDYAANQKKLTPKTLSAYTADLTQFTRFIQTSTNASLDKPNLTLYITHLHATYKPRSVKRKIATLRALFNHLEFEERIPANPFAKIRVQFQQPQQLPRTIPLPTLKLLFTTAYQLLRQAPPATPRHRRIVRDIAILELLFATGVRVSELCTLTLADVDLTSGTLLIHGKGSRERLLPLANPAAIRILRQHRTHLPPDSTHFFTSPRGTRLSQQSIRIIINTYTRKAGIPRHITPHMFRHSFATLLLEEEVDIRYVQHLLGHRSILTTQIYTHICAAKEKTILQKKHPRNKLHPEES